MSRKLKLFGKIAVGMFALGVVISIGAHWKGEQPRSFVVTYRLTRTDPGQEAIVTGLLVQAVNSEGEWKQTKFSAEAEKSEVRFLDKTAAYKLAGTHLDYIELSDLSLQLHRQASSASWFTKNPQFVREDSILGLKAYVWHRPLNDGWWEAAYSPLTRYTPLLDREYIDGVETTREAVSVQFRELSPDEILPPNLPVRFDRAESILNQLRSGDTDDNKQTADGIAERIRIAKDKLRAQGRTD